MQANQTEKIKYLIVGQGLVGTWMSYHLEKAGIPYKIINDPNFKSATSVASGVINPVTGRRIVQTWMIESILPFTVKQYKEFAAFLQKELFYPTPVILIHPSAQMKDSFDYRLHNENVYLCQQDASKWHPYFSMPFGTGAINECYWIDLRKMTTYWKQYLAKTKKIINTQFEYEDIIMNEHFVQWKNIVAEKIIFCEGVNALKNPYFKSLPFAPNKGEALIIKVPGLSNHYIYKYNITIAPWSADLFWVGSSYEWSFKDEQPTVAFKEKMIQHLNQFLNLPYSIIDHIVGIRPTNVQRRPFVGVHPLHPQLAICNGMGTKGCSLAPYFTHQLMEHLEEGKAIAEEADIAHFKLF